MLPHQRHGAQGAILSVSHSHLTNFCNKWGTDGTSETLQLENWTISHRFFLVVMVVHSVNCTMQGGGPGTLLPLQHPVLATTLLCTPSVLSHFIPGLIFLKIQLQSS